MVAFECEVVGGELRTETDETIEARFVAANDSEDLDASPWTREVLPLLYARPDRAHFAPAGSAAPVPSS